MTTETLLPRLADTNPSEFVRIALACELSQADRVVITYTVNSTEVSVVYQVADPLKIDKLMVDLEDPAVSDAELSVLNERLCTKELHVLIRRYLFLLNSSQRDKSLGEFFSADTLGQSSSIDFYPLMNLMTAYYESH